jgi:hypothetical protein
MLKKEFKRKDVQRARNLIMGNSGASTGTQIGYGKKIKDYKEGDVWTEGRKTWTIKNGIKQTVSKLDTIKKEVFMPLCCPKCNKVMKKRLDKPNYKIHKKCHDCVIEFEHKLRIQSEEKYQKYLKNLEYKNSIDILKETEELLLGLVNNISNKSYVSEDGVIEKWVGGVDKKQLINKVKSEFKIEREKLKLNDNGRTKGTN